jgi:hypothetical protein
LDKYKEPARTPAEKKAIREEHEEALAKIREIDRIPRFVMSPDQMTFTWGTGFGDLYDDVSESSSDSNILPGTFVEVRR